MANRVCNLSGKNAMNRVVFLLDNSCKSPQCEAVTGGRRTSRHWSGNSALALYALITLALAHGRPQQSIFGRPFHTRAHNLVAVTFQMVTEIVSRWRCSHTLITRSARDRVPVRRGLQGEGITTLGKLVAFLQSPRRQPAATCTGNPRPNFAG
jgi:hypothetical protein